MGSSLRSFRADDRSAVLELSRHALQQPAEQVGNPLWNTREELESELADWEVDPAETLLVDDLAETLADLLRPEEGAPALRSPR